jgi:hypothetical protein
MFHSSHLLTLSSSGAGRRPGDTISAVVAYWRQRIPSPCACGTIRCWRHPRSGAADGLIVTAHPQTLAKNLQADMTPDPLQAKLDINLRVADLAASKAWYATIFQTQPIFEGNDHSVDGSVVTPMACFRLGGVKFWLLPKNADTPPSIPQSVGLAFMTPQPLAELRALLESRGARFDDSPTPGFPIDEHGVRIGRDSEFIWMVDPDGYHLEFCRVYALSAQ